MFELSLTWTVGKDKHAIGGNKRAPQWTDVASCLNQLQHRCGTVSLDIINAPDVGPQCLYLEADNHQYILMMGECDEEEHHIRTFGDNRLSHGEVEILGNIWDSAMLCSDVGFIESAFREFFNTGAVSQ